MKSQALCGKRENVRIEAVNGRDDGGCATIPNDRHIRKEHEKPEKTRY